LLLCCFAVYHFGFYIFYFSYQYKIEKDWSKRVYQESFDQKQVMKIPMKLPYSFDEEGFQLTNIPFIKDGKSYRAIQKRFIDDTFELVYVPDMAKIKLEVNLKQWVISLSPENKSENQQDKVLTKSQVKDYLPRSLSFKLIKSSSQEEIWRVLPSKFFQDPFLKISTPPPRS